MKPTSKSGRFDAPEALDSMSSFEELFDDGR